MTQCGSKRDDSPFFQPLNAKESVIRKTLAPGLYTVQLSGVNQGTGIGVVEVYNLGNQ